MQLRWMTLGWLAAGLLMGCATPPVASVAPGTPWLDEEFAYQPGQVVVDMAQLFALPADLLLELHSAKLQRSPSEERISFIINSLVNNKAQPFRYSRGNTTVAAETWRQRSGDCLALTVLAYAMARELKLAASMQEINGTVAFDRRGNVDYRVGHVNVYISRHVSTEVALSTSLNRGVVIDFEPSYGAARPGTALSHPGILARYYNNLGAGYLAESDTRRAYAYFKAAMQTDPSFGAAAANLAGLYWNQGYAAAAEALLVEAAAAPSHADAAVRALHRMMLGQGRLQEVQHYQRRLVQIQEREPYYWIDRGVAQLQGQEYRLAVHSLERAQSLSSGFSEVHRYLATAYLLDGQPDKAQEQHDTLALIDSEDPSLSLIQRKIVLARKAGSKLSLNTSF